MGFILRLPSIDALTDREKIEQMRTYLYTTVKEIEYALNTLDTTETKVVVSEVDAASIFATIKPMIIRSSDIINSYYEIMKARLSDLFLANRHELVSGSITQFAESMQKEYALIYTDSTTTSLPEGFESGCVGEIHKIGSKAIIKLTDLSSGNIACNSYANNEWKGWKFMIPEEI